MAQARAINEKIAYPDYLDGDNMTQLENEYAEVQHTNASVIMYYSSVDLSVPNLV
jgi:hypothetical protein